MSFSLERVTNLVPVKRNYTLHQNIPKYCNSCLHQRSVVSYYLNKDSRLALSSTESLISLPTLSPNPKQPKWPLVTRPLAQSWRLSSAAPQRQGRTEASSEASSEAITGGSQLSRRALSNCSGSSSLERLSARK